MVANNSCLGDEIFWFVIGHENPCGFSSGENSNDAQSLDIVLSPVESAHSDQVSRALFQSGYGRLNMRDLTEFEVEMISILLDTALNL